MVIGTLAVDEEGQYSGNVSDKTINIFDLFTHLWQEMVLEDKITQVCINTKVLHATKRLPNG